MGTTYRHSGSHSQHSIHLWSDNLILRTEYNDKSTIPEDSDEKHYYYGYNIPRQLIYSRACIFLLGLSGFFYRLGYGSASSLGKG